MAINTSDRTETSSRTRGRPRGFESEPALAAALELFWKYGYRNTTTRDLESALGLSQSSIYNAFGSKHDLLEAALDRYESLTAERLVQPLEQSTDGLASIDVFFETLVHWVTHDGRRGCMLINMMAEDGGVTQRVTQRARVYRDRVRDALRGALARAADRGEMTDEGLDDRADLLVGLVLGINIAARGGVSEDELARLLDAVRAQVRGWRQAR